MVDREARNVLAEQIRHFLSCLTDNIEFDDAIFDIETDDSAVKNIRKHMWHTYDDIWRHKLTGKRKLSEKDQIVVKRFILFLKTDFEYHDENNEFWPFENRRLYEEALKEPRYLNDPT